METMKLINQPLKAVKILRPAHPAIKVRVQYLPKEDKFVKVTAENRLYWKPF